MNARKELLTELLLLSKPLPDVREQLRAVPWDWPDGPLATLTLSHVRHVLQRFVANEVSATDVELWANLIEGRDDIAFEPASSELLRSLIWELANPELVQKLTAARADEIIRTTR